MRFSINKMELQNALAVVMKGVSTRSTLPILSGILIEAANDAITLQSTDLELSVQVSAPALIEDPGRTVVPGKLFSDIVRSLPDAAVNVQTSEDADMQLTCDTSTFSIRTLNPDDFPGFPSVETSQQINVPFKTFAQMVKRVSRVASRDESRAILTGVLVELEGSELKMVATDSYRLALAKTPIESGADEFSAVIAATFLTDVCSVLDTESDATLALAENQIVITCENTIFINRRIEGNYPNYRQLLPEDHNTRATIDLSALTSSVKRASILSSSSAPMRFDLNVATQTIQIFVNSSDVGSVQETISCELNGEDVEIAFNSAYVSDGLAAIRGNQVYFDVQTGMKPGIFRTVDGEDFLYLIMPVRI